MNVLLVYHSNSGNTQRVAQLIRDKLTEQGHSVKIKNALTATPDQVREAEVLVVGSPVHGYVLFGQKATKEVRSFLSKLDSSALQSIQVVLFATYLFFPAKTLVKMEKQVTENQGTVQGQIAMHRSKKEDLAERVTQLVISGQ